MLPRVRGLSLELCFLQKSFLDIMVGGRKVAAFAQRRTAGAVFQHGSVLVEPVPEDVVSSLMSAGLGTPGEWDAVRRRAGTVGLFGGPSRAEVRRAILTTAGLFLDGLTGV
jgi:lipoate-protein ligase A